MKKKEYESLQSILIDLHQKTDVNKIKKFNIFGCCLTVLKRKTFSPYYKISVKFCDTDGKSEGAIDEGEPTREMFRLVLKYIENSQMFTGSGKKYIALNWKYLEQKHYYEMGRLIALSLVHGGPGPNVFSNSLFSFIAYGEDVLKPTLDEVDDGIKDILNNFNNCSSLIELQEIVTSTQLFLIAGCNFISRLEDKTAIIDAKPYCPRLITTLPPYYYSDIVTILCFYSYLLLHHFLLTYLFYIQLF